MNAAVIKHGYLEKVEDMEVNGKVVPASVLGHRITRKFVLAYFGRVVADPAVSPCLGHVCVCPCLSVSWSCLSVS
jgi:hypothetical protein